MCAIKHSIIDNIIKNYNITCGPSDMLIEQVKQLKKIQCTIVK